ncbi:MAG TPA: histidine kinase [Actinomycetota bacterium]|nr:histidine kinase [Actinomycetota bacterium]
MGRVNVNVSRWDIAVASLLSVLGVGLMVLNTGDPKASPFAIPAFLAFTVPLVWRRVRPLPVAGIVLLAFLGHVALFGELVRCGVAYPVFLVLGYTTASLLERRDALVGLAISLTGVVLVSATDWLWPGIGPLPIFGPIAAGAWAAGRVVHSRSRLAGELERRNEELRQRRDERAAMQVAVDRAKMSAELETLLQSRLEALSTAAEAGVRTDDPQAARALLESIEDDSRKTLEEMRQIVGVLRGSDVPVSPAPSITHLDALLVRSTRADARVAVEGDPRTLPAAVELSAYRIVEQLVSTLTDSSDARIDVKVRFSDDALEIRIVGPAARGADIKAAVARARERAALHDGSLEMRVARGRVEAVAQLPVLATV